jgi:hypothetical protein
MPDTTVTFLSSTGTDPAQVLTKAATVLPSEEAMLYTGARQITRIRERTAKGIDVNGSPFKPYTKRYAKFRVKKGRNPSPVDLTMSGRLLNSMQVEVRGPDEFAITVQDVEAATYGKAHNEGNGRVPRRRFVDTSPQELLEMRNDLFGFDNK